MNECENNIITEKEVWRPLIKHNCIYEVSNIGRIKRVPRIDNRGTILQEKIVKQSKNENGYLVANLYNNGVWKIEKVHRLIASVFIENKLNKSSVNHKNGIKTDNRIENLEWCTYSENHKHAYKLGLRKAAWEGIKGGDNPLAKPVLQFGKGGELIKRHKSAVDAELSTGISRKHICCVCNGKRKSTGGFVWKHA